MQAIIIACRLDSHVQEYTLLIYTALIQEYTVLVYSTHIQRSHSNSTTLFKGIQCSYSKVYSTHIQEYTVLIFKGI